MSWLLKLGMVNVLPFQEDLFLLACRQASLKSRMHSRMETAGNAEESLTPLNAGSSNSFHLDVLEKPQQLWSGTLRMLSHKASS